MKLESPDWKNHEELEKLNQQVAGLATDIADMRKMMSRMVDLLGSLNANISLSNNSGSSFRP